MKRHLLTLALFAALSLPAVAFAQPVADCPAAHVCVEYAGSVIEISPAQGFLQQIVVEEHTTTIKDFNGERTLEFMVKVASFQALGDSYEVVDERLVEREGIYAGADLGDVYVMGEVE
jgi:hypothetical protein